MQGQCWGEVRDTSRMSERGFVDLARLIFKELLDSPQQCDYKNTSHHFFSEVSQFVGIEDRAMRRGLELLFTTSHDVSPGNKCWRLHVDSLHGQFGQNLLLTSKNYCC